MHDRSRFAGDNEIIYVSMPNSAAVNDIDDRYTIIIIADVLGSQISISTITSVSRMTGPEVTILL